MTRRTAPVHTSERSGYALIAALLILFMITLLGILAMVTSTSEQKIVSNISEDKIMFNYGEQGVNRVISHLHYLNQGLFGSSAGGAGFTDTSPKQVMTTANSRAADINGAFGGSPNILPDPAFRYEAWIDPKNFETNPYGQYDMGVSRPVYISVKVKNIVSNFERAFRAEVKPTSIWDLAYYSRNHVPAARSTSTTGETCTGAPSTWFACQTVFHQEDQIVGDVYVRNALVDPDNSKIFLRGAPTLTGMVNWQGLAAYDYGIGGQPSTNQTSGGSNSSTSIRATYGFRNYAKPIDMFPIDMITDTGDVNYFKRNADVFLPKQSNGNVWKILFRNDLDIDGNGTYESDSRVASRYDHNAGVNDGNKNSADPGVFYVYSLPYSTTKQVRAAHWGDTARRRHDAMIAAGATLITKNNAAGFGITGPGRCWGYHHNDSTNFDKKPYYDTEDLQGETWFMFVPTYGLDRTDPNYQIDGTGDCSGTSQGIIFVEGDVLVSGIVDGNVTIVALGNIILDHEIQYEEHPSTNPVSAYPNSSYIDMATLIAAGNIIIPNSYPDSLPDPSTFDLPDQEPQRYVYTDDWSDASDDLTPGQTIGTTLAGRGNFDHPYPGIPDDGNEEVHAIMVSFGRTCTGASGSVTCNTEPTDTVLRNFRVGVYATPRTEDGAWYSNNFFEHPSFNQVGNFSGTLTIWGAIIQAWSGRLGYDHPTSSCSTGSGCRFMGHNMVLYYDNRLKWSLPANPWHMTEHTSGAIPFGEASWDISEWQTIDVGDLSTEKW